MFPRLFYATIAALAVGAPAKADAPIPVESPVGQLSLALTDLSVRVAPEDAPFTFYFSHFAVPEDPKLAKELGFPFDRAKWKRVWKYWINHTNAARTLIPEVEVPGSNGSLYKIDVRRVPNWTRTALVLIADRDYVFRETPLGPLPHREAVFGRLITGIEVNDKTFSAGFILNAYQLFRDSIESQRVSTYYDLLYGKERHPDQVSGKDLVVTPRTKAKEVEEVVWEDYWINHKGGPIPHYGDRYFPPGGYTVQRPVKKKVVKEVADPGVAPLIVPKKTVSVRDAGKGDANFPGKLKDFEIRWGGDIGKEELKTLLFDPAIGGIALAADSDPEKGSIVAVGGDRGIRITESRFGWVGVTYDSKKNVGDTDPHEKFLELSQNKYKADGGEALGSLPNGAQAGFLFNAQEARVELADTDLARIRTPKTDSRYQDVRTMMGCIACHAPQNGFYPFLDQFRDSVEKGVKFKVRAEDDQQVRDFFFGLQRRIKRLQEPYQIFLEDTTSVNGKGWTGLEAWEAMRAARDWYDRPVTLAVAAYEYGLSVEALRQRLLGAREADSPIQTRLNQLTIGKLIPRATWQGQSFTDMSLFLDSIRDKEEPIKQLLSDQLLQDALKKFGHTGKK